MATESVRYIAYADTIEMVLAVESDKWGVDEIADWYRQRVFLA